MRRRGIAGPVILVVTGLQLPHPLLGRLTVREMLAFTLYHNVHHVHVAERRWREALGLTPAPEAARQRTSVPRHRSPF